MKIHFDQAVKTNTYQEPQRQQLQQTGRARGQGVYLEGRNQIHPGNALGSRFRQEQNSFGTQGKTMTELQSEAGATDMQLIQNQMTVMSHTMSDEDYTRMLEEGYDPREMDPQEAVTILDKIKAELVKGGCQVAGYTDTLDMETLSEAVGDPGLARSLQESFMEADIPLSRENIEKTLQALELADGLKIPDEGDYYYMVRNGMEATLRNYYLAEASGSAMEQEPQAEYFDAGIKGYVTRNIRQSSERQSGYEDSKEIAGVIADEEIDRLLSSLGYTGTDQEQEAAKWLVQRGIQVDRDSMERSMQIRRVPFPLEKEKLVQAAAAAIADGREPMEGNLADTRSIQQRAKELAAYYQSPDAETQIADRRLLEEIRLYMTAETNLRLLESDFSIDTQPIEETIEALKQVQQRLAQELFPGQEMTSEGALDRYQQLENSWQVAEELPQLPVAAVGRWQELLQDGEAEDQSIAGFYHTGKALQAEYERAGQRYETIWTAPRANLGDSIHKAFANVDDILQDLGYEPTQENQRAVRILGYNRMEITPEHVEEIKAACEVVDDVVKQMTPAAVLRMIRDGINPLEQSLPQLQEYFAGQDRQEQETEAYSRFLYKLEKKGEITQGEKSAFIGCYRLLRQIEKGDSAAIGSVVNSGAEMNFSTLLSAVRTRRAGHMNTLVDDAVGSLSRLETAGIKIDEQINLGYAREWNLVLDEAVQVSDGEAAQEGDGELLRQEYARAAAASEEIYKQLERAGESPSAANVLAAQSMEAEICEILSRWNNRSRRREKPAQLWDQLHQPRDFKENYREELEAEEEQLARQILEETDNLVDVRSLQLMSKQLHLMSSLSGEEEYYFPMELGEEMAAIHLQICHGREEKGMVRIELTSVQMGSLKGEFQIKDGIINGYFAGKQREAVMNLRRSADIFDSYLAEGLQPGQIEYVYNESGKTMMSWDREKAESSATQESLYAAAKAFLQTIRDVEKLMEGTPA